MAMQASPRFTAAHARLAIGGALVVVVLAVIIATQHGGAAPATSGCPVATAPSTRASHGPITEFGLPHPQSDLMYPAVDAQGNIWFGEMGGNRLGRLDTQTGMITEWSPPQGQNGIMGIAMDAHGDVWFAEEAANYIGRFTPATCTFKIIGLGTRDGAPGGPDSLVLAPDGRPWFTLFGNNQIGTIDPATNQLKLFPLTVGDPQHQPLPYGITLGQDGGIWFTLLGTAAIGRLDPASGQVRTWALATPNAQPNAIITAPDGRLWFTEMNTGVVGVIDPHSGTVHEFPTAPNLGTTAELYDLAMDHSGAIWITSSGANALLRFDPRNNAWQAVPVPTPGSAPYGITMTPDGVIWFTEGAVEANHIARYTIGG